jgi:1-acyl-sn-glycerol-3-phosphate acyltransferase
VTLGLAARLLTVLLHLIKGLLVCTLLFPWLGRARRLAHIQRWSAQLLRIFRVQVEVSTTGLAPEGGMWVANHISWLDVFVIDAVFPARFVAKSDVRRWPLVGALAASAGTIFVDRTKRGALRGTMDVLADALRDGERVMFFPEGTSAEQGCMLPFRANLFEAAIQAQVPVQPVALSYRDQTGRLHGAVAYIGQTTLIESIVALLTGPPVHAHIALLPTLPMDGADRRTLAHRAHDSVSCSLDHALTT